MQVTVNKIYKPLFQTNKRYILLYGGRAGGRSYAASQKVILDTKHNKYSRAAIMRYILGDVRSSVWQEIKDRLEDFKLPEPTANQSMSYEFNGNVIDSKGFKKSSGQNTAKLKSLAGYNLVWLEEAEEIAEEDFNNLDSSIRTKKGPNTIILSFNMPYKDHWIIKRWFNLIESDAEGYYQAVPKDDPNTEYIFATYHDNKKHLPEALIQTYEAFKERDPEYYYTMIKGYVSEGLKGRVFTDWKPMSTAEYEALEYPKYYGLDFGFTNDPSALVEMKFHNDRVYLRQLIYEKGLTNPAIAEKAKALGVNRKVIADSAEPKSIEELNLAGLATEAAVKGTDSIRSGINLLKEYEIYYTEDSKDIATEIQNYVYRLDRDKNPTNEPIDDYNHLLDAIRYVGQKYLTRGKKKVRISWV